MPKVSPHAANGATSQAEVRTVKPWAAILGSMRFVSKAVLSISFLLSGAASADSQEEAERLCLAAGRNGAIFERLQLAATASGSPVAGVVACTWSFAAAGAPAGRADLTVQLETSLFANETLARFAMTAAMLPENNRGWTVEALPRLGDGGVMRIASKDGVLREVMIEAVKGRRRFVLTAQVTGNAGTHRLAGQVLSFFGAALGGL